MSWREVVSPIQRVTFLGIEFDSTSMTVRLPVDKLPRLNNLVYALSTKESGSKRQLQLCVSTLRVRLSMGVVLSSVARLIVSIS